MKSWQTTIAGIAGAVVLVGQQIVYLLDSDPATVFNLSTVIAAVTTMVGFIKARDNNKSSESVGAK